MKTYRHSGTLGDLIYSLAIVKKMKGGHFKVAIQNLENCISNYHYRPEDLDPQHQGRFTEQDFAWLAPLIQYQSYVDQVSTWRVGDQEPDVDLDQYRGVLYRTFEGNILEAYHKTFNMPFRAQDYDTPWLTAGIIKEAPVVVSRSSRYRPPDGDQGWRDLVQQVELANSAVFVGTLEEHTDFVNTFGVPIKYRPVKDFLELASIINGAELFLGNQGFAYSLATGLGKPTVLEINKLVPMQMNECYFPRPDAQYF